MQTPPQPDPSLRKVGRACLARRMRQASRLLTGLYDEALRAHGIKTSQLNVLVAVGALGAASPGDLVDALDLEKSSVSRAADRLVEAGWLEALEAEEGRGVRYAMTAEGRARLAGVLPDWRRAQSEARRRMGAAGARALLDLVASLGGRV